MRVLRSRQRSQSVVEFGIIAILFTLIMFAIADFGLLLNDWLTVTNDARQLARSAAVGVFTCSPAQCTSAGVTPELDNEAASMARTIPGLTADAPLTGLCCGANSALVVDVTYWNQCTPGVGACQRVDRTTLDRRYSSDGQQGTCSSNCAHPSPPRVTGNCPGALGPTCPGDSVQITITAYGQIVTPLVRTFFTNDSLCKSNAAHCFVPLSTTLTMRFEGDTL